MRRTYILTFALLVFGFIGNGLSQMVGYYPKGGPDVDVQGVSVIQLIANPQNYDGKTIRLHGFLHLEFEGNFIYLHSDDFRYGLNNNGLWIEVPKDMTQAQIKAVNDQYVICTARFAANWLGRSELGNGELTHVSRLEVWPFGTRPTTK